MLGAEEEKGGSVSDPDLHLSFLKVSGKSSKLKKSRHGVTSISEEA